jgi:pyruvate kinase
MSYPTLSTDPEELISEELCTSAAILADSLKAAAIVVYTRRGHMASFLSRRRPSCPILAVTGALRRLPV